MARDRNTIEIEILAERWALAEADTAAELTGDYSDGDLHLERLRVLWDEASRLPHPRQS